MNMNSIGLVDQYGKLLTASDTAYDSASYESKELYDWSPSQGSADADLLHELDTIVARSHDLTRNNGVAAGYSQTLVDNIVGPELRLASKPNYQVLGKDKEWADEWARNTEARFRVWAKSTECDATRKQNFGGMTQLVLRTGISDGEALAVPYWLSNRRYSTAIMLIDPKRLSNPSSQLDSKYLRKGIKLNKYGEAIGYHIRKSHPYDVDSWGMADDWEYIASRNNRGRTRVLHVHDKKRNGQSRGEPFLSSVMGDFKMAGSYQKIELRTAIANSLIAAFIESSMEVDDIAEAFDANFEDYLNERKAWKSKLTGGDVIQLPPGDKLNAFTPSRPAGAFSAFMEGVYRNISTGLNIPYELLMKDFSKTNYSSARAAMLEAWRFFKGRREWLADHWCQPVYELWLEEAVMRGEIEAPGFYENKAAYCSAKWIGPGRGWVDVVKEAKGAELRMDKGLSTQQDECAEQGKDYEEVQDQRASELKRGFELAQRMGLPMEAGYRIAGFSAGAADQAPIETHYADDADAEQTDTPTNQPNAAP